MKGSVVNRRVVAAGGILQHEGLGGEQTGRRRGAQTVLAHTEGEAHVLGIGRELGIGEGVVSLVALLGHHRSVVRAGDVLVQVVEAEVDDALLAQRVEVFTQHEEAVVVFVGGRGGHLQPGAHVGQVDHFEPKSHRRGLHRRFGLGAERGADQLGGRLARVVEAEDILDILRIARQLLGRHEALRAGEEEPHRAAELLEAHGVELGGAGNLGYLGVDELLLEGKASNSARGRTLQK